MRTELYVDYTKMQIGSTSCWRAQPARRDCGLGVGQAAPAEKKGTAKSEAVTPSL